ncbi:MAG TPA: chorismate mutase [Firmicutes bacterium]|jgi:chorismate mutase|nr:chorismate mutase [Bacillota bacterium]HAW71692.1 chorismate mutase [Bacillota bacterium]HAZ23198.1 chorismate mutase [Bacillota bacterium]HBG44861.1 chorismate mutase [Bacillota bacterium]HBL51521.1 chorismate mutase [Bacillota bacterium]
MNVAVRGIRGAITVDENSGLAITEAVVELLRKMTNVNGFQTEDLAAVLFSSTPDLNAGFPATAARTLPGYEAVPLFGTSEINPPGSLPQCVRILILWNTDKPQSAIRHIFLKEAAALRPDLEC